ncbi:hypothetical protein HMPREF2534_02754 [Bacteroides thetaiotaomicron]|nr:hypothetical protein HMPREF2534_02754 [Bacteroides thetaiotaomicron]
MVPYSLLLLLLLIDLTYNIRNIVLFFVSDAKIKAETPPLQKKSNRIILSDNR